MTFHVEHSKPAQLSHRLSGMLWMFHVERL
jgi:hypothetical protein